MNYSFLSLWILPFGLVLALRVIPAQWRGLRRAAAKVEQTYWLLNLAGYLIVAFGTVVTGSVMLASLFGRSAHAALRWPWLMQAPGLVDEPGMAVLLGLLATLVPGLMLVCIARYFGYVDENDCWCRPDWLAAPAEHGDRD